MIAIIMGSTSDLAVMSAAAETLEAFDLPYETTIVSAHRTPLRMVAWAKEARARGITVVIAGAGGAAHLPGMVASLTPLPVVGVPVRTSFNDGLDSLLSIAQMPRGVPVATVGVNNAQNAALLAVRIVALGDPALGKRLDEWISAQTGSIEDAARAIERQGWRAVLGDRMEREG